MDIELEPIAVDDAESITRLQLVENEGLKLLAGTGRRLAAIPVSGHVAGAAETVMELGFGPDDPSWDARVEADGSYSAVYTVAGSAVKWVMLGSSKGADEVRVHQETFGVFGEPRFVRGGESVTAVTLESGRDRVALFSRGPGGEFGPYRPVGEPQKSLVEARMLRGPKGYLLILASSTSGLAPDRAIGRGSQPASVLHAVRLDEDLQPVGETVQLLGNRPVYELDVTTVAEDRIALLATTPEGLVLALGALGAGSLPEETLSELPSLEPLTSPSLLASGSTLRLAAIRSVQTPDATILVGSVELPAEPER